MIPDVTHLPPTSEELPPPEQCFEWPREAMRNRDWEEAARRWAVLRKAYPNHPATWFQGANTYIEAGELDKAEKLLAQACQQFPNHPSSLTDTATLAMRRQAWDLAEDYLTRSRERHPENLQTWMKSAECAENKGDLEQAAVYYQSACQCAPDRPAPFVQYAELAMRAEHWGLALERWKRVRDYFPELQAGFHRAAEAARQLGRHKEARQFILAHQYGTDILENSSQLQKQEKKCGSPASLPRLAELIWTKAVFNLRSEVHRNYLSYGWWVLEPLLHMVVYYVVFGLLLQRGGENYTVFLLSGLIPWMWFMKAVSVSSSSILGGQSLMLQVGLPSLIFPLVSLLQATLKQIPVFILLFAFVWFQGYNPGAHWWALIPVIIVQTLFTVAFSCAVAAIIPFARDLSYLVPTGLTFLMFLSGIFYDYRSISAEWRELFLSNPIAFIINSYREILMEGAIPNLLTLTWWGLGSGTACLLLILAYKKLRYIYPRIIME